VQRHVPRRLWGAENRHKNGFLQIESGAGEKKGVQPDFILVNISVDFVDPILATAVEVTVAGLDRAIKRAYPIVQRIFIEVETWRRKSESPKMSYMTTGKM
jgi:hypothetical protein